MFKFLSYLLIIPIWFYQKLISPFFPATCRFNPTCSNYAIEALKEKDINNINNNNLISSDGSDKTVKFRQFY